MARTREIKPGFFINEELGELPALTRLFFIALWTVADRNGRMLDQPKRLRAKLLPYDHLADGENMIAELEASGFLVRYRAEGQDLLQIENFDVHQSFHPKEKESDFPGPEQAEDEQLPSNCLVGVQTAASNCIDGCEPMVSEIKRDLKRSKDLEKGQAPEPKPPREPQAPAYALPDRGENPRKPHPGWKLLWFSDRELELLRQKFTKRGLREEFHSEAYRKVSVWFSESPSGRKQYSKSACHADRVGDFGLTEALKAQATSDNAKAASQRASSGGYSPATAAAHPSRHPPPRAPVICPQGPVKNLIDNLAKK